MGTFDSRLKRLGHDPRFVLINNYKCGFSSSSLLGQTPARAISADDRIVFFYRNIVSRAISVFINWCVTDRRWFNQGGWLFVNLARAWDADRFQHFLSLIEERQYGAAFRLYVDAPKTIASKNNHTLPQVAVPEYYELGRIDHFVELENCGAFARLTSLEFPHVRRNQSDPAVKSAMIRHLSGDRHAQAVLEDVYRQNLDFFARHGLECRDWSVPGE